MKKNYRLDQIVRTCNNTGFISISKLAKLLNVSEITIRRDIDLLYNLHLIKKVKGGVQPFESPYLSDLLHYNFENELAEHTAEKKKIGQRASTFIKEGETIIFDSGSTLLYMVQSLPLRIPITAICYGFKIADELIKKKLTNLIVAGGLYRAEIDMFENISEYNIFNSIRADKAFISAFGIHLQAGLTSGSFFASSMRKKAINSSEKVILLVDSSKFGKIEWAHFANIDEIDMIITDNKIDHKYIKLINEIGIPLIIV